MRRAATSSRAPAARAHEADREARERLPADHRARGDRRRRAAARACPRRALRAARARRTPRRRRGRTPPCRSRRTWTARPPGRPRRRRGARRPAAPLRPGRRAPSSAGPPAPRDRRDESPTASRFEANDGRASRRRAAPICASGDAITSIAPPRPDRTPSVNPAGTRTPRRPRRRRRAGRRRPTEPGLAKRHEVEALEQIRELVGRAAVRVAVRRRHRSPRTLRFSTSPSVRLKIAREAERQDEGDEQRRPVAEAPAQVLRRDRPGVAHLVSPRRGAPCRSGGGRPPPGSARRPRSS